MKALTLEDIARRMVEDPYYYRHRGKQLEEFVLMRFALAYRKTVDPDRILSASVAARVFSVSNRSGFKLRSLPLQELLCMTNAEVQSRLERENSQTRLWDEARRLEFFRKEADQTGISFMPQIFGTES